MINSGKFKSFLFVFILAIFSYIFNIDGFEYMHYVIGKLAVILAFTLMVWTYVLIKIEE